MNIINIHLFSIFNSISKNKILIISTCALSALLCFVIFSHITPKFEATARIKKTHTAGELLHAWMWPKSARSDLYGELELLRSEYLFRRTVERLGLAHDQEFGGSHSPNWADNLVSFKFFWPVFDALWASTGEDSKQLAMKADNSGIAVASLMASISVNLASGSMGHNAERKDLDANLEFKSSRLPDLITVSVQSIDPKKAALIANTFADVYISDYVDRRIRKIVADRTQSEHHQKVLKKITEDSEYAVARFISAKGLADNGQNAVTNHQIAAVNAQLAAQKSVLAEKRARLPAAPQLRASGRVSTQTQEIHKSPALRRLQDQESGMLRQIAQLDEYLGDYHPTIIKARALLSEVRLRIQEEHVRIAEELNNDVRIASARVGALSRELETMEANRLVNGRDVIVLRQLKRVADVNRRVYQMFLAGIEQTESSTELEIGNVMKIVSPAVAPVAPVYPRVREFLFKGIFVSLGLSGILIFCFEYSSGGFRRQDQIEEMIGLPSLGTLPWLVGAEKDGRASSDTILDAPETSFGEAIRSIRTGLIVSDVAKPPKTILIASALRGEGKTSLAVSLARQSAVSAVKRKVILVDCDLRQPAVSAVMGLRAEVGILQLLEGRVSLQDVLKIDPKSNLHVLPAMPGAISPTDWLNSRAMRDLLDQLSDGYDLVIVDSPAIDHVSDARILARMVDTTLFVVQWSETPRKKIVSCLKQLTRTGAKIAGIVVNMAEDTNENPDRYAECQRA